ncbi:bifunctional enzyme IspD/IspF [Rhodospirillales bacterium TMPK1]|uniref:Bifunctional enzyme IspD/IspF n=1 Tax=Roseiterribacter gracilis TaxID=2812848 RepID=A0A8S8XAZ2_9PROT|nr:bifunctional enzyme IspD/IspF [Rhodospirillales bacterium TMPK1]
MAQRTIREAAALIVAGGAGTRLGAEIPKQYLALAGRPLIRSTIEAFLKHRSISRVQVVIGAGQREHYEQAVAGLDLPPPIDGGATRQDSVRNGLEALAAAGAPSQVLIHDAARPLVSEAVIDRVLGALASHEGAIAALPVADTLRREDGTPVDRTGVWRAQTPQGFRFATILAAHRAAIGLALTDDAAVAERAGHHVELVLGDAANLKVTTMEDLAFAERLATLNDIRMGSGFDVHTFGPGDHVWLGGVRIPHDHGVVAHSDGDVALHALTDAILGAIGDGDIGTHFPPSDMKWKNAASDQFLAHANDLVRARGGRVVHVDITVLAEAPKVGPHRAAMVEKIGGILGLPADRVSIKATTTEGMGFTGRREGLAAQAVATVRLP